MAIGGNEICTLRSILSTSNPSLAILIGNLCLCIFTFLFPLWLFLYYVVGNQLLHSIKSLIWSWWKKWLPWECLSPRLIIPSVHRNCARPLVEDGFYRLLASFSLWFVERSHMLRCDMCGIYIYIYTHMCVWHKYDIYTLSEVLNNFISLATQKMTYTHLEGKKKWGEAFSPCNQTMAQILATLAAVLAPSQQL